MNIKVIALDDYLNQIQEAISRNQLDEALNILLRAIDDYPTHAKLHINCGNLQHNLGLIDEAQKSFEAARKLSESKEVLNNSGVLLIEKKKYDEAIEHFLLALTYDTHYPDAHYNLSVCYDIKGNYEETLSHLKKCLSVDDSHILSNILLFKTYQNVCDWENLGDLEKKLNVYQDTGHEHPFLNITRDDNEKNNYQNALRWYQKNYIKKDCENTKVKIGKSSRKNIGFICGEIRNHPTFHLIKNLFKYFNREKVNLFLFYYDHDHSFLEYLKQDIENLINVNGDSDDVIESKVKSVNLDILIDLSILIPHNKMSVLDRKLAPITISYLGYPGTSGSSVYDYIIADKIVIPEDMENFYSEKVLHMPGSYQVNDGERKYPSKKIERSRFNLPKDALILCCFNQSFKIDSLIFKSWLKILKDDDRAYLWLLEDNLLMRKNILSNLDREKIDENRIIFAEKVSRNTHLERLSCADIALDTRIYNGHTSTTDAIQCGVPVVTLSGNHFASRVSHSLLLSAGLSELVTFNLNDYIEKIRQLSSDDEYRQKIRAKLQDETLTSEFYNIKKFARDFETTILSI